MSSKSLWVGGLVACLGGGFCFFPLVCFLIYALSAMPDYPLGQRMMDALLCPLSILLECGTILGGVISFGIGLLLYTVFCYKRKYERECPEHDTVP